jgi:hypothetical protein
MMLALQDSPLIYGSQNFGGGGGRGVGGVEGVAQSCVQTFFAIPYRTLHNAIYM